ncbi:sulfotransferase domain-containing protein [Rhodoligotrophos defluvii]|uniref:sulfotransferase domain-containing protein n=1 Tax=Rhodoligotrophos defluvii TaxID=2561934 RepID=UPI0010C98529|nr:sulfotransferase domain-containing protein [Rhodoligotrophos defluvii]
MRDKRGNTILLLQDFSLERLIHNSRLFANRFRVVSYPRSGRTWLRVMLHDLRLDPRFTHAASKPGLALTPAQMLAYNRRLHDQRILHLVREPRDVMVSYYHHLTASGRWQGSLKDMIRDERHGFARILAFDQAVRRDRANYRSYLEMSYEAMRADPVAGLTAVTRFLGARHLPEPRIRQVVAAYEFSKMKEKERSGELAKRFGARFVSGTDSDSAMTVRRGVIGGYADMLDDEDLAYCDALLERYGQTTGAQAPRPALQRKLAAAAG